MRFALILKFLSVALVLGLIAIVLARIGYLVDERRARQQEAVRSVELSHAGAQTLLGPWVQRQCTEEWEVSSGEGKEAKVRQEKHQHVLRLVPDQLQVGGQLRSELRERGLYRIPTYDGTLQIEARWAALPAMELPRLRSDSRYTCQPARLLLALSDVRGVRAAELQLDGVAQAVRAGTHSERYAQGVHVELPPGRAAGAPLRVLLTLGLAGTGALGFVPAAGATEWKLASDWAHPSFSGRFLPTRRTVTAAGFDALWQVSALSSAAADQLQKGLPMCGAGGSGATHGEGCLDTVTVAFFDPVNPYVLSDRAIKYGLLFVLLTFAAVALAEVLSGRRVHPVQYLLVGLALSIFFLLLLSLSEHLAFASAYAVAAAGCALLLAHYAVHLLGRRAAGLAFGAGIAGLYGLLYLLLQMEQNALAVGSVGLFAALAAVMVLTRNIDWYALFDGLRPPAARSAAAPAAEAVSPVR
jgi:inner membrane protein